MSAEAGTLPLHEGPGHWRRTSKTLICRSPWGLWPATFCEVHQSEWPSGAFRCDKAHDLLGNKPIGVPA